MGAVQAVETIRLGVRMDTMAATTHIFHVNIYLADRLLKRRTRAVAARARAVDSVGVAAPGAFLQLREEAGHPHIPSWYFCTLDMSNAPDDSAHAHNSEETIRGARRAAST